MKIKNLLLALFASAAVAFSLAACGGDDHDHDGHDHGDGDEHAATEPAAAAAADDGYPLKTCVVSGEELGSMGEPVVVKHGEVTVKLCCKSCIEDFEADPAKYAAMVKKP